MDTDHEWLPLTVSAAYPKANRNADNDIRTHRREPPKTLYDGEWTNNRNAPVGNLSGRYLLGWDVLVVSAV